MANYYYVKHDGTATGDAGRVATTPSTGSFAAKGASAYYDSIQSAVGATTPPAAGDFIYCSSAHSFVYANHIYANIPNGVSVISVDDSNCDQYLAGAVEKTSPADSASTNDVNATCSALGGFAFYKGIEFSFGDDFRVATSNANTVYEDVTLDCNYGGTTIAIDAVADGNKLEFRSCHFDFGNENHRWRPDQGAHLVIDNCDSIGLTVIRLIDGSSNDGGMNVLIKNTDLTGFITASTGYLLTDIEGSAADQARVRLERCKLPAWGGVIEAAHATYYNWEIDIVSCTNPATPDHDAYYYFQHLRPVGNATCDTTTYLNATYDGTNGFSALLEPDARSSIGNPLRHKLCEIPAQSLTASVDVTVEFTCASTLTDTEFWLEVVHPDATDNALGVTVSTRNTDVLATGTTHTTSSETWTVGKTYKYKDTATIPALTGVTNGTLEVYVCLADPTAAKDVWVDPAVTVA